MNTNIPLPERRWMTRFGLPILIIAIAAAILIVVGWQSLRPATSVDAVTVVVRSIETDTPSTDDRTDGRIIQAPGWVEADPFSVYAGALVEGVVESILVLEGDRVAKGQPVATLISDDARIARDRVAAQWEVTQQQLKTAIALRDAVEPELAAADAQRRSLVDEYQRKEALVENGAVAAGPVERLKIAIDAANADIARLEAREQVLDAEVHAAEARLAVAASDLEESELALSRTTVVSPIEGIVIERLTSPGSVVGFGNGEHATHIVHLYDPEKLQVRADVPLADAAGVGVGHPAEVIVDVLPDRVFTGEVTRFVHRADLQKNTVEAKVRIHDPADLLKPDMLARVRILQPETAHQG
ncbi:MAG: efflux RND transporter periplasmic adaptor subunit, partial [Phycisphaerales bacterium]|nr:efflux RND transporter periplasmic adaptor subunit [Phycisphaerales bacterium]